MSNSLRIPEFTVEIVYYADGSSEIRNFKHTNGGSDRVFVSSVGFEDVPKRLQFFENRVKLEGPPAKQTPDNKNIKLNL